MNQLVQNVVAGIDNDFSNVRSIDDQSEPTYPTIEDNEDEKTDCECQS